MLRIISADFLEKCIGRHINEHFSFFILKKIVIWT